MLSCLLSYPLTSAFTIAPLLLHYSPSRRYYIPSPIVIRTQPDRRVGNSLTSMPRPFPQCIVFFKGMSCYLRECLVYSAANVSFFVSTAFYSCSDSCTLCSSPTSSVRDICVLNNKSLYRYAANLSCGFSQAHRPVSDPHHSIVRSQRLNADASLASSQAQICPFGVFKVSFIL